MSAVSQGWLSLPGDLQKLLVSNIPDKIMHKVLSPESREEISKNANVWKRIIEEQFPAAIVEKDYSLRTYTRIKAQSAVSDLNRYVSILPYSGAKGVSETGRFKQYQDLYYLLVKCYSEMEPTQVLDLPVPNGIEVEHYAAIPQAFAARMEVNGALFIDADTIDMKDEDLCEVLIKSFVLYSGDRSTEVTIKNLEVSSEVLHKLAELIEANKISSLTLSHCQMDNAMSKIISDVIPTSQVLMEVNLNGNLINEFGLMEFNPVLFDQMRSFVLSIAQNPISETVLQELQSDVMEKTFSEVNF